MNYRNEEKVARLQFSKDVTQTIRWEITVEGGGTMFSLNSTTFSAEYGLAYSKAERQNEPPSNHTEPFKTRPSYFRFSEAILGPSCRRDSHVTGF